jgi:predicted kinase
MLIVLAGLPAVGKTSIARALARRLDAVHVRIDAIEHELRESVLAVGEPMDDRGYAIGRATASASLRMGRVVIADSVNPWPQTRDAWVEAAQRAGCPVVEVEIICSDAVEHRRRVETRTADPPGFTLPAWRDVVERDYRPWDRERTVVDTAMSSVDDCVARIVAVL